MAAKANIRDGERLSITAAGPQSTRVYDVTGLSLGNQAGLLWEASNAGGLPRYGDPHPVIPSIQVTGVDVAPVQASGAARATITYTRPDITEAIDPTSPFASQLEFSSGLLTDTTVHDVSGTRFSVRYAGASVTGSQIDYPTAQVEKPIFRCAYERRETSSPFDVAIAFTGAVNRSPWSGRPAKTWRCEGVRSRVINRGQAFLVAYDLAYNPETWRFKAESNVAGQVPEDAVEGNGFAYFDVYQLRDFAQLGFTIR